MGVRRVLRRVICSFAIIVIARLHVQIRYMLRKLKIQKLAALSWLRPTAISLRSATKIIANEPNHAMC